MVRRPTWPRPPFVWIIAALAIGFARAASAQPPVLHLDHLNRLTSQARNVVNVALDSSMLQVAAGLLPANTEADVAAKAAVAGLKGVSVRSLEFDQEGVYAEADVDAVRAQLGAPWSRILSFTSRQTRQRVEAYMWRAANQPDGLAVILAEPKKLTIVNVVGHIDLSELGRLSSVPGIPAELGNLPGVDLKKP